METDLAARQDARMTVRLSRSEIRQLVLWHHTRKKEHALADRFEEAIDEKRRADELSELIELK